MSLPSPQSDLALTAFRYLAGELESADASAFECRLESEEAAQQALIEAVQISAALQQSSAGPALVPASRVAARRPESRTSRRSGVLALVGSALVAATVLLALRDPPEPAESVASTESSRAGATVALWTALDLEESETSPVDEEPLLALEGDGVASVQVPDWMFAAIETDFATGDHLSDPAPQSPPDATDEDS